MAIDLGDAVVKVKADTKAMMTSLGGLKKQVGLAMAAVGTGIVVGLGKAVKSAGDFEQAITNAASVTGKTGDEFLAARDKMEELALTLGEKTKFSAKEAADAMYDLSSKGFDVAAMSVEELKPILDLAAATQNELTATTETATATLRGFGMENKELTRIADVMTLGIGKSAAKMELFGISMPIVSTTAKLFNVTLEETVATLGNLYDKGINASTSATGLRNIMMDLSAQPPRITKGFKALGISLEGVDIKTQGLSGAFKILRERGLKATEAAAIFGKRSGTVAAAVLESVDATESFTEALKKAGGTSAAVAEIQLNTLTGQWDLMTSKLQTVIITVGKALLPVMKDLFESLGKVLAKVAEWAKANPGLTKTIIKLTAVLGLGLVAGGLILAFSKLALAVKAVTVAVTFLTAHPLVALITLITGSLFFAISALIRHWDDFRWAIKEVGRVVVETMQKMKDAVTGFFSWFGGKIRDFLTGPLQWFQARMEQMGLRSWFIDVMENMATASTIAFSTITGQIQGAIVEIDRLRAAMRAGFPGRGLGGIRGSMDEARAYIRRMMGLGLIDQSEILAELERAQQERVIARESGVGAQGLSQWQRYISWLMTLVPGREGPGGGGVNVTVQGDIVVREEADVQRVAETLHNMIETELGQGGSRLGIV